MLAESSAFHTAVFDALCACLNLSAAEGVKLIHEAYAEPENAPRPARNKNVIYWTVLQDLSADPVSTVYDPEGGAGRNTPVVYTTLKYRLIIVCYGPASEAYAQRIRHMLFLDGAGFPDGSCGMPGSFRCRIRRSRRFCMRRREACGANGPT